MVARRQQSWYWEKFYHFDFRDEETGVSTKSKVRQLVIIKRRIGRNQTSCPNHISSESLIWGCDPCNSTAHTSWYHTAPYYSNYSKTGPRSANIASYPSPWRPVGLAGTGHLHPPQSLAEEDGEYEEKWSSLFSGVQTAVDGALSFRSQNSSALILLPHRPRGKPGMQKPRGDVQ